MDAARWARVQTLFHDALDVAEPERRAFLEGRCADDPSLVGDVVALLEADAADVPLLDGDLAAAAATVVGPDDAFVPAIGPYRLVRPLGEGGMGVVYLAERTDLGSRVAIKMLRDAALSPARRERFAIEQRLLARLSHPGIARLYDASTLPDGTPYFVMEFVDGVPLTDYCAAHECTLDERLALFRQACEAVQFAHGHAVVHRDLKPSNLLVLADGTVKLLDFGISKQLDPADAAADQTRTALRLLTPAYAAPEQLRGEPVGTYTDVYALGVLLYELLTGRLPYDLSRRTPGEVEAVVLDREPERPSVVARRAGSGAASARLVTGAAWADLDVLCMTAMQKDPSRRYRTVDALMRDVDHFLHGEPLDARPDSARYRLGKLVRRKRRPLAAAAAAVVALLTLAGFYTVRLAAARDAAVAEAARAQRIQRFMLDLFEGGDETSGPADTLQVVTLVERGTREAGVLDGDPAIQAELYATLGGIYHKLGDLGRADSLLDVALDRRRALAPRTEAAIAENLVALGLLRMDQARLDEAERLVREGLDRARTARPANHPEVIAATAALGSVLRERGDYEAAAAVLEDASRLQATHPADSVGLADILRELADVHFYAGRYEASDSLNELLLGLHRRLHGENHPSVADDLINLGATRFQTGDYAAAERYDRDALAITAAFHGTDHPKYAANLTMLGRALVFQERYDEATEALLQALRVQERAYGPDHPRVASALNELGNAASAQGDLAAAESYFQRLTRIYTSVYGAAHQYVAVAISNLASVYMNGGENARAEPLFRDAVARFTAALSPDHIDVGIARIKLGRVLTRQARYAEAEPELLAGYDIVAAQASPGVSFLRAARTDLVTVYEALDQPERAARFRAELADSARAGS